MTPVALATSSAAEKPPVRYLDYLRALETLKSHRVNPAPPFGLMIAFAFSLHIAIVIASNMMERSDAPPQEHMLQLRLGGKPELGEGPAIHGGGLEATLTDGPRTPASLLEEALGEPEAPPVVSRPELSKPAVASRPRPPSTRPSVVSQARRPVRQGNLNGLATASGTPGTGGRGVVGGSEYGNSTSVQAEVISRYEQELSGWLEKHKVFPAEAAKKGLQGRVVVRVQMNRQGKVLGSWVETSSGHDILDKAVLAQVRRADPFPKTPETYPGSAMLEFRFPVTLYLK